MMSKVFKNLPPENQSTDSIIGLNILHAAIFSPFQKDADFYAPRMDWKSDTVHRGFKYRQDRATQQGGSSPHWEAPGGWR